MGADRNTRTSIRFRGRLRADEEEVENNKRQPVTRFSFGSLQLVSRHSKH